MTTAKLRSLAEELLKEDFSPTEALIATGTLELLEKYKIIHTALKNWIVHERESILKYGPYEHDKPLDRLIRAGESALAEAQKLETE